MYKLSIIPENWKLSKKACVGIKIYDPKKGPPPKIVKSEPVDIPVIHHRDDAGEQGALSQS